MDIVVRTNNVMWIRRAKTIQFSGAFLVVVTFSFMLRMSQNLHILVSVSRFNS